MTESLEYLILITKLAVAIATLAGNCVERVYLRARGN
jgi:hypothetical protein